MPLGFLRRLRKKASPDPLRFGGGVCEVMRARISRGMTGRLSAEEARRMILEKHAAGARAQFAYLEWLFKGNPAAGAMRPSRFMTGWCSPIEEDLTAAAGSGRQAEGRLPVSRRGIEGLSGSLRLR